MPLVEKVTEASFVELEKVGGVVEPLAFKSGLLPVSSISVDLNDSETETSPSAVLVFRISGVTDETLFVDFGGEATEKVN